MKERKEGKRNTNNTTSCSDRLPSNTYAKRDPGTMYCNGDPTLDPASIYGLVVRWPPCRELASPRPASPPFLCTPLAWTVAWRKSSHPSIAFYDNDFLHSAFRIFPFLFFGSTATPKLLVTGIRIPIAQRWIPFSFSFGASSQFGVEQIGRASCRERVF